MFCVLNYIYIKKIACIYSFYYFHFLWVYFTYLLLRLIFPYVVYLLVLSHNFDLWAYVWLGFSCWNSVMQILRVYAPGGFCLCYCKVPQSVINPGLLFILIVLLGISWFANAEDYREPFYIYPTRRPDLDGLISSYSPILVGRFIFVVHLFTEATALAGARSMEGLHSSSWLLQAQDFVSSSCIAIKAQVTHNSLALRLLFSFWLLGHFSPQALWAMLFLFYYFICKTSKFPL